jgi:mannose PTS system EIIA component
MTGLLILAHAPLASALRAVAGHVYAEGLDHVQALDVAPDWSAEQVEIRARQLLDTAGRRPTLILVDVCGATPCNAARRLAAADPQALRVVAGLSVPMLWRALCYRQEDLEALTIRVLDGGQRGVMLIPPDPGPSCEGSPCQP